LADEVRKEFAIEPELIRGTNGIFDVDVDGKLVFSKHKLGRFPEPGEIVTLLREKVKK